ncbi:MAG: cobalamin B12-binding domain-containing protein, partial [Thermodesulfovibrionia bacterium]|nr:cobalamin B12-binding domain-containing protein [Thermodesulfovibrionia bacterium]
MIKKIFLIDIDNDKTSLPQSQLHSRFSHHPVGLMYLASSLHEKFPDIEVIIFHTITSSEPYERISHLIRENNPDLIGLRALSIARKEFNQVSGIIRKNWPDVPIVAGG